MGSPASGCDSRCSLQRLAWNEFPERVGSSVSALRKIEHRECRPSALIDHRECKLFVMINKSREACKPVKKIPKLTFWAVFLY